MFWKQRFIYENIYGQFILENDHYKWQPTFYLLPQFKIESEFLRIGQTLF